MASKLPSVPETTNTTTVQYGSGSAVTSSSCPVNAKEAPPLASAMAGDVVARGRLVKEGVTGEEKPTMMGCQRDSCANRCKASEDRVVRGTSEATHSRLCVGVSTLVRTDSTGGSTHDTAQVCPARELVTTWHTSNDGADGPQPHVELEASEG